MTVSPVQGNAASLASSATQTISPFASNITVGDQIVLCWRIGNTTATVSSVTDNLGNTWVADQARFVASSGFSITLYRCVVTVGGACTITISTSASVSSRYAIEEYSGLSSTTDGQNTGTGTGTTFDSGAITTTVASDTLFGFGGGVTSTSLTEGGTGTWTTRQASSGMCVIADQIGTSAGTYNWQPTVGTSQAWAVGISAYEAAVSGVALSGDINAGGAADGPPTVALSGATSAGASAASGLQVNLLGAGASQALTTVSPSVGLAGAVAVSGFATAAATAMLAGTARVGAAAAGGLSVRVAGAVVGQASSGGALGGQTSLGSQSAGGTAAATGALVVKLAAAVVPHASTAGAPSLSLVSGAVSTAGGHGVIAVGPMLFIAAGAKPAALAAGAFTLTMAGAAGGQNITAASIRLALIGALLGNASLSGFVGAVPLSGSIGSQAAASATLGSLLQLLGELLAQAGAQTIIAIRPPLGRPILPGTAVADLIESLGRAFDQGTFDQGTFDGGIGEGHTAPGVAISGPLSIGVGVAIANALTESRTFDEGTFDQDTFDQNVEVVPPPLISVRGT